MDQLFGAREGELECSNGKSLECCLDEALGLCEQEQFGGVAKGRVTDLRGCLIRLAVRLAACDPHDLKTRVALWNPCQT